LVSDIPAGDGKMANSFLQWAMQTTTTSNDTPASKVKSRLTRQFARRKFEKNEDEEKIAVFGTTVIHGST
jgi:hypothetical protein